MPLSSSIMSSPAAVKISLGQILHLSSYYSISNTRFFKIDFLLVESQARTDILRSQVTPEHLARSRPLESQEPQKSENFFVRSKSPWNITLLSWSKSDVP